jgi:hypothetical protein
LRRHRRYRSFLTLWPARTFLSLGRVLFPESSSANRDGLYRMSGLGLDPACIEVVGISSLDKSAEEAPRFKIYRVVQINLPVDFRRIPMRARDGAVLVHCIDQHLDGLPTLAASNWVLIACWCCIRRS